MPDPPTEDGRRRGPFEPGRICVDCDCILSVYNPGPACHQHEHLHLDEPVDELRLDQRNLPSPAIAELARLG